MRESPAEKLTIDTGEEPVFHILFCGDRHWTNRSVIDFVVSFLAESAVRQQIPLAACHGACRGADRIAGQACGRYSIPVKEFPYIGELGKAGGPARNSQMLREFKPHLVIAFHEDLHYSKGTKNMVEQALAAGVKVVRIDERSKCWMVEL
jgi:hypothetical protein